MGKPRSYPFLRISQEYDMSYAHVLAFAEVETKLVHITSKDVVRLNYEEAVNHLHTMPLDTKKAFLNDLRDAVAEQAFIRNGFIDWMTGEPTGK